MNISEKMSEIKTWQWLLLICFTGLIIWLSPVFAFLGFGFVNNLYYEMFPVETIKSAEGHSYPYVTNWKGNKVLFTMSHDWGAYTTYVEIEGADPESFEALHRNLGKDKNNVYYKYSVVEGVSPDNFTYIERPFYWTDGENIYCDGANADKLLLLEGLHAKTAVTSGTHYISDSEGEITYRVCERAHYVN